MLLDAFTLADPAQYVVHLGQPVAGNDKVDAFAYRFGCGKPEHAFGRRVPAGDRTVKGFRHDGVVGRFDRGAE